MHQAPPSGVSARSGSLAPRRFADAVFRDIRPNVHWDETNEMSTFSIVVPQLRTAPYHVTIIPSAAYRAPKYGIYQTEYEASFLDKSVGDQP